MNDKAKWLVLFVISIMVLIHDFIMTGINVATVDIAKTYGIGLNKVSYVISTYVLFLAATMLSSGALGSKYGSVRVFIIGLCSFTLGALIAAFTPTFALLVVSRALQGVGTGLMLPNTLIMILKTFPRNKRGSASGIVVGISGVAMALGPTFGGFLIHYFNWRWLFYFNIFGGVIGLLSLFYIYPKISDKGDQPQAIIHLFDNFIFILGLCIFLYIIPQAQHPSFYAFIIPFGFSICLLSFFIFRQKHSAYPLIPFALFQNRYYVSGVLVDVFLMFSYIAILFLVSLNLHTTLKLSTFNVGKVFLAMATTYALASPFAGWLYDRMGGRLLNMLAAMGSVIGLAEMIVFNHSLIATIMGLALMGIAIGVNFSCMSMMSVETVEKRYLTHASAFFFTTQYIGAALGASLSSILMSAISGFQLSRYLSFYAAHLNVSQMQAIKNIASGLSGHLIGVEGPTSQTLLNFAHQAFTVAYRWSIGLCLVVMLANLFISIFMIPKSRLLVE